MLVPVVADPEVARAFMDLLIAAETPNRRRRRQSSMLEGLDSWHHELGWRDARRIRRGCGDCSVSAATASRRAIARAWLSSRSSSRPPARSASGGCARARWRAPCRPPGGIGGSGARRGARRHPSPARRRRHAQGGGLRWAVRFMTGSTSCAESASDGSSASHENNFDRGIWNATVEQVCRPQPLHLRTSSERRRRRSDLGQVSPRARPQSSSNTTDGPSTATISKVSPASAIRPSWTTATRSGASGSASNQSTSSPSAPRCTRLSRTNPWRSRSRTSSSPKLIETTHKATTRSSYRYGPIAPNLL